MVWIAGSPESLIIQYPALPSILNHFWLCFRFVLMFQTTPLVDILVFMYWYNGSGSSCLTHQAASHRLLLASQQQQHVFCEVHGPHSRLEQKNARFHIYHSPKPGQSGRSGQNISHTQRLCLLYMHTQLEILAHFGTKGQKLVTFQNTSLCLSIFSNPSIAESFCKSWSRKR